MSSSMHIGWVELLDVILVRDVLIFEGVLGSMKFFESFESK